MLDDRERKAIENLIQSIPPPTAPHALQRGKFEGQAGGIDWTAHCEDVEGNEQALAEKAAPGAPPEVRQDFMHALQAVGKFAAAFTALGEGFREHPEALRQLGPYGAAAKDLCDAAAVHINSLENVIIRVDGSQGTYRIAYICHEEEDK